MRVTHNSTDKPVALEFRWNWNLEITKLFIKL